MKKKWIAAILMGALITSILSGCGKSPQETTETAAQSEEITDKESEEITEEVNDITEKEEEEAGAPYYEEGRACLYGLDGKEIDLEAACTNFEKALELGKTEANFYLGVLSYCYHYPEIDDQKAKTYFEAAGDDPYAQILLGDQYYFGKGVDEDKAKGQQLTDAVIARGYAEGYAVSGNMAYEEEDYTTAFECYNKAVESEEPLFAAMAMNQIGYLYECGDGVEQDYAAAMEWYEKSADLEYSYAMERIGHLYENGMGVEQDSAKAQEWYEKAGVPEKAEAAKKEASSGDGSSNDTGFVPQTYVGPNGTFVANTEEEMLDAMAKAMGAEIVTIEGNGETGGGSLAGLGVGVEVNSQ